jgi:hypothetical protein
MKAVLEFSYPEDEQELRFALNGAKMYQALTEIKSLSKDSYYARTQSISVLQSIETISDEALKEVHK